MSKKPRKLQKLSLFMGRLSFFFAFVCGGFALVKSLELGVSDQVTTSFMAAIVFFVFVGVVLFIMGKADIPDLRINPGKDEQK